MSRMVEWFVDNPIASNLLMVIILLGGITTIPDIDKQFFPIKRISRINVEVVYPGAGPAEVEQQISMRIEEAISDLDGIEELNSFAREGSASISVEVESGFDSQRLLNNIRSRVDAITSLPVDAERPQISEQSWDSRMLSLAIYGDLDEASLKEYVELLRERMARLPEVALVKLRSPRRYEMAVEVSESQLRRYGLVFEDVVSAINNSSLNLPAGKIKADAGDIQIQTRSQAYNAEDFENILLRSNTDGLQLRIGDVAEVIDGFEEINVVSRFNGKPSVSVDVYVTSNPDVLKTSEVVNAFVEKIRPGLPPGLELDVWRDESVPFRARIATLVSNGVGGLLLVFIVLVLFLRPQLAFWVCSGIAVSFLGAIWFLPLTGASLNMVSLFAFILILGIIVDDAIIVAESIYSQQQAGDLNAKRASVVGAQLVLKPVLFAVISTIVFFGPMYFIKTDDASPQMMPSVVVMALFFSLVESLFILPPHLATMKAEKESRNSLLRALNFLRQQCSAAMLRFSQTIYLPFLARCMAWKGLTLVSFILAFFVSVALLLGDWIGMSFFPKVPIDYITTSVEMPQQAGFKEVEQVLNRVHGAAKKMKSQVNSQGPKPFVGSIEAVAYNNSVRVTVELTNVEQREISGEALKQQWQSLIGALSNAEAFEIVTTVIPLGPAIELELAASDINSLEQVSALLREQLATYPGVYNIRDTLENPRQEMVLRLKPAAENLNVTPADITRQIRRGFFGEEVQRIPRQREDVKVMVRYPERERGSEYFLYNARIRTAAGSEVPFETVAEVEYVEGFSEIERRNGQGISTVTADLQSGNMAVSAIIADINRNHLPYWQRSYPDVVLGMEGEERQRTQFMASMMRMMLLSAVAIFGLIAIAFRSYWQPLLVLSAVPFGFMGSVFGHVIIGIDLSMFSMMGMLATAGVVVNDNLVLIDKVNRLRAGGMALTEALKEAAGSRFRPIVLTSLTTFVGLVPIMAERSVQAQFLIPMVVSLAFGVLFATLVTLVFVPVLFAVIEGWLHSIRIMGQKLLR